MGTLHGQIVNSDFIARHPPQPGQKSLFDMRPVGDGAEEEEGEEEAAAAAVAVAEEEEGGGPCRHGTSSRRCSARSAAR